MSWASVIFVLTWKANKKDNVMLPGVQGIRELNFRWIVILYSEDDICILINNDLDKHIQVKTNDR